MKWFNPKYVVTTVEDGGLVLNSMYLGDEDDCVFGGGVDMRDEAGGGVYLCFPEHCNRVSSMLLQEGHRLLYVADGDKLPYEEVAASYDRLGRSYQIGRSHGGSFYVHCRLNNGHGFITEV